MQLHLLHRLLLPLLLLPPASAFGAPSVHAEDIVAASFGASRLDDSLFGLDDGWGQLDEHAFDVAFDVRQGLGLVLDERRHVVSVAAATPAEDTRMILAGDVVVSADCLPEDADMDEWFDAGYGADGVDGASRAGGVDGGVEEARRRTSHNGTCHMRLRPADGRARIQSATTDYTVRFAARRLGVRLVPVAGGGVAVMDFARAENGELLPAEASRSIVQGDLLMAVNGVRVAHKALDDVARHLQHEALPLVVRFRPGSRSVDRVDYTLQFPRTKLVGLLLSPAFIVLGFASRSPAQLSGQISVGDKLVLIDGQPATPRVVQSLDVLAPTEVLRCHGKGRGKGHGGGGGEGGGKGATPELARYCAVEKAPPPTSQRRLLFRPAVALRELDVVAPTDPPILPHARGALPPSGAGEGAGSAGGDVTGLGPEHNAAVGAVGTAGTDDDPSSAAAAHSVLPPSPRVEGAGMIHVVDINSLPPVFVGNLTSLPALFGPRAPRKAHLFKLALMRPTNGCTVRMDQLNTVKARLQGSMAVAVRGGCTFAQKATNAMLQGASAIIIVNNQGQPMVRMPGGDDGSQVSITAAMVDHASGQWLQRELKRSSATATLAAAMCIGAACDQDQVPLPSANDANWAAGGATLEIGDGGTGRGKGGRDGEGETTTAMLLASLASLGTLDSAPGRLPRTPEDRRPGRSGGEGRGVTNGQDGQNGPHGRNLQRGRNGHHGQQDGPSATGQRKEAGRRTTTDTHRQERPGIAGVGSIASPRNVTDGTEWKFEFMQSCNCGQDTPLVPPAAKGKGLTDRSAARRRRRRGDGAERCPVAGLPAFARLVVAEPARACEPLTRQRPAGANASGVGGHVGERGRGVEVGVGGDGSPHGANTAAFVLVEHGGCPLSTKIRHAVASGAAGVILVSKSRCLDTPRLECGGVEGRGSGVGGSGTVQTVGKEPLLEAGSRSASHPFVANGHATVPLLHITGSSGAELTRVIRQRQRGDSSGGAVSHITIALDGSTVLYKGVDNDSVSRQWMQLARLKAWDRWPRDKEERSTVYRHLAARVDPRRNEGAPERNTCLQHLWHGVHVYFAHQASKW
jgi:hypothetical protein